MIDFLFVMLAAGANSVAGGNMDVVTPPPEPAPLVAPAETPEENLQAEATPEPQAVPVAPASPTVNIGSDVTIGSGTVIGGASLLDGTAEEAPTPTAPQVAAIDPAKPAAPAGAAAAGAAPAAPAPAFSTSTPAPSQFNMAVVPAGLVAEPQTPSGKFTTAVEVKPILNATKGNWVAVREFDGKDLLYVTHLWSWRCGLAAMAISVNDEPMQNWPLPPCHMEFTSPNAILEQDGVPMLSFRPGSVQKIDIQVVYDDLTMDAASFERGNVLMP